jgi:crotonobetainyl-CoA:carnitine CoA-transferase CaiB-like acyl-CoA transferase
MTGTTLAASIIRDEWAAVLDWTGACVALMLATPEALHHPQPVVRGAIEDVDDTILPMAVRRFDHSGALPLRRSGAAITTPLAQTETWSDHAQPRRDGSRHQ